MSDNKIYTMEDLQIYGNRLHINTILEIIINGLAGYVVLKYSTKAMKRYKYYILSTIFWAFLMDFNISFIFGPFPILPTAILCSAGVIGKQFDWFYGRVIPYCLLHLNLSFAGISIINGIMYQYYSLLGEEEFFHSTKGITILFFVMLLYPLPSIISLILTLDREGAIEFVQKNAPYAYDIFITAPCNTFVINTLSKVYFGIVLLQITFMVIIAWIYFFRIQTKLYQLRKSLSSQTIKARRQLVLALMLQLFVPAILLITPILIMIGSILLKVENLKAFSSYAMQILALHSCANALTVLTVITPYRKVLHQWILTITYYPRKLICKEKSSIQIMDNVSTQITTKTLPSVSS